VHYFTRASPSLSALDKTTPFCYTSTYMKYLQSNPGIAGGELTIKGTRIRIASILEMLAAGMTLKYIATQRYPWLPSGTITGALREASQQFEAQQPHA